MSAVSVSVHDDLRAAIGSRRARVVDAAVQRAELHLNLLLSAFGHRPAWSVLTLTDGTRTAREPGDVPIDVRCIAAANTAEVASIVVLAVLEVLFADAASRMAGCAQGPPKPARKGRLSPLAASLSGLRANEVAVYYQPYSSMTTALGKVAEETAAVEDRLLQALGYRLGHGLGRQIRWDWIVEVADSPDPS